MKHLVIVLILGLMLVQATPALADDPELTRRLVGTWIDDPAYYGERRETITYYADGTCIAYLYNHGQAETAGQQINAVWSIKNSILTKKTTSSNTPEIVDAGIKVTDRIISISENRFVYQEAESPYDAKTRPETKVRKK